MLTAALSSLALAMTLSAHMQVGLQAVLNDAQPAEQVTDPAEDAIEEVVEVSESDPTPEPVSDPVEQVNDAAPSGPVVSVETDIAAEEAAQPEPELQPVETQTPAATEEDLTVPPQNGEIPEEDWPAILSAASTALAAAETATGRFIQTNADGSITPGSK